MLLSRVPPPSLSTPGRSRCAAQELKDTNKDTETSGIRAILVDESNKLHWKGEIRGPQGTAYEGGKFAVDIVLPNDYPFVPPKVRAAAARFVLSLIGVSIARACWQHRIRLEKKAFFLRDGAVLEVLETGDLTWEKLYEKGWRTAVV